MTVPETAAEALAELERMRRRCADATPGPWLADELIDAGNRPVVVLPDPDDGDKADLFFAANCPRATINDAEFIAEARNDMPKLLAMADGLMKLAADLDWHATELWGSEQPTIQDVDLTEAVAAHRNAARKIRSAIAAALNPVQSPEVPPVMTETTAPMTAGQIAARLDGIAPYPHDGPVAPRALAAYLATDAQRRWYRDVHQDPDASSHDHAVCAESAAVMLAEFAAVHLLLALGAVPHIGALAALQIRDAWMDGGAVGELLHSHLAALGVDSGEVNRLEEARQALTPPQEAPQSAALDIALTALRKLSGAAPVAGDGGMESSARRRLALRAIADIEEQAAEEGR